jgi:hypothetical protein
MFAGAIVPAAAGKRNAGRISVRDDAGAATMNCWQWAALKTSWQRVMALKFSETTHMTVVLASPLCYHQDRL